MNSLGAGPGLRVVGELICDSLPIPPNSVGDSQVKASEPITAAKLYHRVQPITAQDHGSAVVARREPIHVAYKQGTIVEFACSLVVASTGNSTITIDLYKNGVTVLTTPLILTATNATAYTQVVSAISNNSFAADEVYETVVTVNAGSGTLGQGITCALTVDEKPS